MVCAPRRSEVAGLPGNSDAWKRPARRSYLPAISACGERTPSQTMPRSAVHFCVSTHRHLQGPAATRGRTGACRPSRSSDLRADALAATGTPNRRDPHSPSALAAGRTYWLRVSGQAARRLHRPARWRRAFGGGVRAPPASRDGRTRGVRKSPHHPPIEHPVSTPIPVWTGGIRRGASAVYRRGPYKPLRSARIDVSSKGVDPARLHEGPGQSDLRLRVLRPGDGGRGWA